MTQYAYALIAVALLAALAAPALSGTPNGFERTTFLKIDPAWTDAQVRAYVDSFARSGVTGVIMGGVGHHYLHDDLPQIDRYISLARKFVDACHARGIKVAEHHSAVLTMTKQYTIDHPDWMQRDFETGEISVWPEYKTYAFCPNNPDFREHYWKAVKDLIQRTGVDALMSDDAVFHHGCCCAVCARRWNEEVGGDIREAYRNSRTPGTSEWRQFNEVRRRWYEDFRAWLLRRQKIEMPGVGSLALAGNIASFWGTQTHGGAVECGLDTCDTAVWEIYNPGDFYSWRRASFEAAALAEACRMRNVAPLCLPYGDTAEARDKFDPEEETFMWGLARANGLAFTLSRVFLNGLTPEDGPRDYWLFERDKLGPYLNSQPVGDIAIFFSHCSRDADPEGDSLHSVPAIAWGESLQDASVPYRVVVEETLEAGMPEGIKTLILPNVFAVSDRCLAQIERFVRDGGVLIASYLPAICDEHGNPVLEERSDRLAALLGVRFNSADLASKTRAAGVESCGALALNDRLRVYKHAFGRGEVIYLPSLSESAAFQNWQNNGAPYSDPRDKTIRAALVRLATSRTPDLPIRIEPPDLNHHILTTVRKCGDRYIVWFVNSAASDLKSGTVVPVPSKVVWAKPGEVTLRFTRPAARVRVISLDSNDDATIERPGLTARLRGPRRVGIAVVEF